MHYLVNSINEKEAKSVKSDTEAAKGTEEYQDGTTCRGRFAGRDNSPQPI